MLLFSRKAGLSASFPGTAYCKYQPSRATIVEQTADSILHNSHAAVFQEWLCFELERQKQEIEEYFSGLEGHIREVLAAWLKLEPCRNWVPEDSRDVERTLFYTDLGVILELMRAEYGVASRDPDS